MDPQQPKDACGHRLDRERPWTFTTPSTASIAEGWLVDGSS
jgi:hypothetical protein